jgi:dihydropteroate synthase
MGVLNVTPDSFSDGGQWFDGPAAIEHGLAMVAAGASVVDVGGESTRPGADPVATVEELRRVLPVVEALAPHTRVSIDTMKVEVAEAAVEAGATLVNDVSGSLDLARVAARTGAGWVCMHMQGTPRTMQRQPEYTDVVAEVRDWLTERAASGRALGVGEVWIDPGIGFGKTLDHNLALLAHLDQLVATGWPVLVGTSRKSFLGTLESRADGHDRPAPVDDRLEGSLASVAWAAMQGVHAVRVHDVEPTAAVLAAVERGRRASTAEVAGVPTAGAAT